MNEWNVEILDRKGTSGEPQELSDMDFHREERVEEEYLRFFLIDVHTRGFTECLYDVVDVDGF